MPQLHDYRHHFRGLHGCPSVCRVRVYRGSAGATIVIATELDGENRGTSITNANPATTSRVLPPFDDPDPPVCRAETAQTRRVAALWVASAHRGGMARRDGRTPANSIIEFQQEPNSLTLRWINGAPRSSRLI